jgi:hypothetical protein
VILALSVVALLITFFLKDVPMQHEREAGSEPARKKS